MSLLWAMSRVIGMRRVGETYIGCEVSVEPLYTLYRAACVKGL